MSKLIMNSMEVLIAIGLLYGMFKYWNKKLRLTYEIESSNRAFGLFLFFQVITMIVVIIEGIDPQSAMYMEDLTMFGNGAYEFWSIVGVKIIGFIAVFILANLFGHILFSAGYQSEKPLYEQVKEDNWQVVLIACGLILTFGLLISYFVLRPFMLEWISSNATFIPLT